VHDGNTEESSSATNQKADHFLERLCVMNVDYGMINSTAVFFAAASTL
jgi:hypothetical protein